MKNLFFVFALFLLVGCGTSTTSSENTSSIEEPKNNVASSTPSESISEVVEKTPTINENVDMGKPESKMEKEVKEMKKEVAPTKQTNSSTSNNIAKPEPKEVITTKKEVVETKVTTKVNNIPTSIEKPKEIIKKEMPEPKVEPPVEVNEPAPAPVETPALPQKITSLTHKAFDGLLRKYVSGAGNVNYKGIKNDVSKLDAYLSELEKVKVSDLSGRKEKMAFWINAYNAYTIKLILNNYPLTSITNLHGGKPWDVKWIKLHGKTLSLNNIENLNLVLHY